MVTRKMCLVRKLHFRLNYILGTVPTFATFFLQFSSKKIPYESRENLTLRHFYTNFSFLDKILVTISSVLGYLGDKGVRRGGGGCPLLCTGLINKPLAHKEANHYTYDLKL